MAYDNNKGGRRPPGSGAKQGGYKGGYRGGDSQQSDTRQGGYRREGAPQGGYKGGYRKDDSQQSGPRQGGYRREGAPQGGYKGGYRGGDSQQSDTRQGGYRQEGFRQGSPARDTSRQDAYERRDIPAAPEAQPGMPAPDQTPAYFLMGRNAVREAIKSGRSIDRILVLQEQDGSLREITALAKERGVPVQPTARARLDTLCMPFGHNGRPGNHQGIIAMVPELEYSTLEDILSYAQERGEAPLLLLLDEINDPHNLGSMLRSAACAGVHGVVIPKRRAASITAAVAKASAGAVEYVKVAKVSNLTEAIRTLKQAGVWIAGGDLEGTSMYEVNLTGPLAIVVGNEGEGLSRLVRENCDHLVRIPIQGPLQSLNASVAAAVLLFEKVRQDAGKQGG